MSAIGAGGEAAERRVVFVTSNGTGLGHLTRSMAIARRLDPAVEPFVITFSAAAPVVRRQGFPVEYIASYDRPGAGTDIAWTLRARDRLRQAVSEIGPDVVVFDGTHPYERLLPALRSTGAKLVWCRRAMWRPDADTAPLHRTHLFDAVLEPGELDPGSDGGPTAARRGEAHAVDPVVLLDRADLSERRAAAELLGLDPDKRTVLVQLGQGAGAEDAARRCLRHLAGLPDVQVAAATSHLAVLGGVPDGVVKLEATYPVARFFPAFDAAVAAAGYNAFHELIAAGVPALFVPIDRETDDQAARARSAEARGVGLAATGPRDPALEDRLDELLSPARQAALRAALAELGEWRGAEQAARWLEDLARASGGAPERSGAPAAGLGVRARRAWIFASSVPRTIARITSQRLRRPRARVLVLALGLDGARHDAELERALAARRESPEQLLVVTDRLDFGPLLRAGVGFEHVPAEGERQPGLAGVPYPRFRERRLELIRAHRPRLSEVVELR